MAALIRADSRFTQSSYVRSPDGRASGVGVVKAPASTSPRPVLNWASNAASAYPIFGCPSCLSLRPMATLSASLSGESPGLSVTAFLANILISASRVGLLCIISNTALVCPRLVPSSLVSPENRYFQTDSTSWPISSREPFTKERAPCNALADPSLNRLAGTPLDALSLNPGY